MRVWTAASAALLAVVGYADALSSFSPANPPSVPLAVRSPYLNTWLDGPVNGGSRGYLAGVWPRFWTQNINGWTGFITVDGAAYNWMGAAPGPGNADQVSLEYTSTRSTFTFNVAGKIRLVVEFLSPIFYDDYKRQSMPFSYLSVSVATLDGAPHDVQIYTDVSAEWASGDPSANVQWKSDASSGIRSHSFWRQDQSEFNEWNDQASWGTWHYTTGDTQGLTYQIGEDTQVRGQFLANSSLNNQVDTNFRAVNRQWPVFAFSHDLGSVGGANTSVLYTIGYAQDNAILFQGDGNTPQKLPPLWKESMDEQDMVLFTFSDYDYADAYSRKFDSKIFGDSVAAGGQDYATITALACRQAFGGLQFVGNQSNTMIFLKEISSDSDIQTVDVIFPTWPMMLYLRPQMIKMILVPLLINQESGHYPNKYATHDLGRYPQALGYPNGNDEPMPLEECGNMIIMMLSYALKTGDLGFLRDHYTIMAQWAQFLIDEAKIPANQLSTDDFLGQYANQTNLALKGILALEGMSQIAAITGINPAHNYSAIAHDYYNYWNQHGINHAANPPHGMLGYDQPDTWGLLYNSYADKALRLNFLPQQFYDDQSTFYLSQQSQYGVKLDTRSNQTKGDWEMWIAAVSNSDTRSMLISKLARWINETPTWRPFADLYDVNTGGYDNIQFNARPVVGGMLALLALP